jgi:hypothetical protein
MVFQAIRSKFSCATFQKPSNTSHFVPLFLAHEDVVDEFVIFHTKLSTPWLGSFICSSLFWQGSWSDHYNLKKKEKEHSSMVCESWSAPDGIGSPWFEKEKRWGGVQSYKRAPMCQLIKHLGTALTYLVWKISWTPLLVVDKSNHLSK